MINAINDSADQLTEEASHVVLHTLVGDSETNSIHLQGTISSTTIQILVDSGATLNFIQPKWLPLDTVKHFDVLVDNGDRMHYSGVYSGVTLHIDHTTFTFDLYVTPF